jgi:sporulation protein YlmC with PRC-barrel domain
MLGTTFQPPEGSQRNVRQWKRTTPTSALIRGIVMEAIMQTDARSRQTPNLIASDRVEGTPVRSTDGNTIGTIERVMIDKVTGKVAHAVLRSNGVGMANRHLPIRWSRLTYDRTLAAYHLDLTEKELSALSHGSDIDWGDRGREMERHDDDRVKVYWGIAETW